LRRPDSGRIRVLGHDPRHEPEQVREELGVQSQESQLPDRLRVGEALNLFASFYRNPADPAALLKSLGLRHTAASRTGSSPAARNNGCR
jgi:ABC-2 type transport system ATP-binding protein